MYVFYKLFTVGVSKYGGITSTLTAYESLFHRGYSIRAVAMIDIPDISKYGNVYIVWDYLAKQSKASNNNTNNSNHSNNSNNTTHISDSESAGDGSVPQVVRLTSLPSSQSLLLHDWFAQNDEAFRTLLDACEVNKQSN
jgi:hypothetical protein